MMKILLDMIQSKKHNQDDFSRLVSESSKLDSHIPLVQLRGKNEFLCFYSNSYIFVSRLLLFFIDAGDGLNDIVRVLETLHPQPPTGILSVTYSTLHKKLFYPLHISSCKL